MYLLAFGFLVVLILLNKLSDDSEELKNKIEELEDDVHRNNYCDYDYDE